MVPASGSYAYFESDAGDFVGGGKVSQYPSTTALTVMSSKDGASVQVADWSASFVGMLGIGQLAPGYYGSLGKPTNPTRGSLGVAEQSRGCSMTTGWFAVDNVVYASGIITALELRFEQHCEDMTPALHGAIRFAGP